MASIKVKISSRITQLLDEVLSMLTVSMLPAQRFFLAGDSTDFPPCAVLLMRHVALAMLPPPSRVRFESHKP